MHLTTVVAVLAILPWSVTSEDKQELKLPSYIKTCYRDDPKVAKCIKKNIQTLMPLFKSGNKEFDLKPLDPLRLHSLALSFKSPILGGKMDIPNAYVNGLSHLKVLNVRPKVNIPSKFELGFDINYPFLNANASYDLSGNVARIPVNMRGNIDAFFESTNFTYLILGDVKTINDTDYLILKSFTWNLMGEGIRHAYLGNDDVVIGRPTLNTLTKTVVNSSWRQLKDNALPSILKATSSTFKNLFLNFFKKYPYDILFPKRTRSSSEE